MDLALTVKGHDFPAKVTKQMVSLSFHKFGDLLFADGTDSLLFFPKLLNFTFSIEVANQRSRFFLHISIHNQDHISIQQNVFSGHYKYRKSIQEVNSRYFDIENCLQ